MIEKTFDTLIDEILSLWENQKEKAKEAEVLLNQCDTIEEEMDKLLKEAEEMDSEAYEEFLTSFSGMVAKE